eukprot:m.198366 g.198366  ORF g.198366 m.198366 type:complete len:88 (+) comp14921_c2_seq2:152-415(+)
MSRDRCMHWNNSASTHLCLNYPQRALDFLELHVSPLSPALIYNALQTYDLKFDFFLFLRLRVRLTVVPECCSHERGGLPAGCTSAAT